VLGTLELTAGLLRRTRYRRADLRRVTAARMTGEDSRAAQSVRWVTFTSPSGRPRPSLKCPSRSRIAYDLDVPPGARVAAWCAVLPPEAAGPAVVEFEIGVQMNGTERTVRQRVEVAAGAADPRWRSIRLDFPKAGAARVVFATDPGPAGTTAAALWGEPRIELRRSVADVVSLLRSTIARASVRGVWYHALPPSPDRLYRLWVRQHEPSPASLQVQRSWSAGRTTRFTLVTFLDDTRRWRGDASAESLLRQSYPHWEWLVLATGPGPAPLTRLAAVEPRVRVLPVPGGTARAAAWNAALRAATGEVAALLDAGDTLSPSALYSVARELEAAARIDVLYCDEDRIGSDRRRRDPRFKPDWSPDLILATNYIGRLAVFPVSAVLDAGGFRSDCPGAEEWDLWLRLSRSGAVFRRLTDCLYHAARPTTDADPRDVVRMLTGHCVGLGLLDPSVSVTPDTARVTWRVQDDPLVSIVIPNRNAAAVLDRCVSGILEGTRYRPIDLVLVDNRSTDADTIELYRRLTHDGAARIVPFDRPFNFSAACNAGAMAARGGLLLFLNNDVEVLDTDWLDELVRWALRPEIGVAGARLLYPDRLIQHAGVVLGLGLAGHIFARAAVQSSGIFGSSEWYRNYLAVTGACQMIRRDVFEKLGGFDERFRLSFSDVVLCMEAWKAGYRVVCTPHARLVHHESYTREGEDPSEDMEQLAQYLRANGFEEDPFFHPELNPASPVPALRPPWAPTASQVVRESIGRILSQPGLTFKVR
jgi:GT2 family glycosyltransferase